MPRALATAIVLTALAASACGSERSPPPVTPVEPIVLTPPGPEPVAPEPVVARPRCERRVTDHLDDSTRSEEEIAVDENGRPKAAWERWTWKRGDGTEREIRLTYAPDGRLLRMTQNDTGFSGSATTYETKADLTFEHGPHGEVVLQRATGSQRTTRIEWKGTFREAGAVPRPPTPWDRTFIFSLSLPQDLRSPGLRQSMPPFLFEGTVTMTTDEYGVESVSTYDREGRMSRHQANVGRFTNEYEYDDSGRVLRITSDDGRVTTYRYEGDVAVSAEFEKPGDQTSVQTYERDGAGRVVGSRYEKGGTVTIRSRYGPCEHLE
ncbi:MAG: RHS repeat protein [Myxococcales bacterium]|nr:RHS repeat protein [Myxococcales bacterium]